MEGVDFSMTRAFSAIGNLQDPYLLRYTLTNGAESIQICLTREKGGRRRMEQVSLPGYCWQLGLQLVQFLYENAIQPEQGCEVVSDLIHS